MKQNLFKLGMSVLAMGLLASCGGGQSSSSSQASGQSSNPSSQSQPSTGLTSDPAPSSEPSKPSSEPGSQPATGLTSDPTGSDPESSGDPSSGESSGDPSSGESSGDPSSGESSGDPELSSGEESSEEVPASRYSLIGSFGGFNWNKDVYMSPTDDEEIFVAVQHFAINDTWKIRVDAGWDAQYNALNLVQPNNAELQNALVDAGGNDHNIKVTKAGTYTITLDIDNEEITYEAILDENQEEPEHTWGLIGTFRGDNWTTDIALPKNDNDEYVLENLLVEADTEFKVRADGDWKLSYGFEIVRTIVTIESNFADKGGNILVVVGGVYSFQFIYGDAPVLYITPGTIA